MHNTVTIISSIILDPNIYNVTANALNSIWKKHAVGWDDLENWSAVGSVEDPGVYDDGEDGCVVGDVAIIFERALFVCDGICTFCFIEPSTDVVNSRSLAMLFSACASYVWGTKITSFCQREVNAGQLFSEQYSCGPKPWSMYISIFSIYRP